MPSIRQGHNGVKEVYGKSVTEVVLLFGNVHREDNKIAVYIDRLYDKIGTVVIVFLESLKGTVLKFEVLVYFPKLKDEACRARARHINRGPSAPDAAVVVDGAPPYLQA